MMGMAVDSNSTPSDMKHWHFMFLLSMYAGFLI